MRVFEAAGRHQSFKLAADELAVSAAAVSRQVRDLEARVGTRLFDRGHRTVRLSEDGAQLLARLTPCFDAIDAALAEMTVALPHGRTVRVSVEPTFASTFLIPRLADFSMSHPDIEVQIDSSARLVEVGEDWPLAIRHSLQDSSWPRAQAKRLIDNLLTPMAAPGLVDPPLEAPVTWFGFGCFAMKTIKPGCGG